MKRLINNIKAPTPKKNKKNARIWLSVAAAATIISTAGLGLPITIGASALVAFSLGMAGKNGAKTE